MLKETMIFLLLTVLTVTCVSSSFSSRVVGGSNANITEAPFTASLLVNRENSSEFSFHCAATIIASTAVVTSAQCVTFAPENMRVRVGSSLFDSGGVIYEVSGVKVHEDFNKTVDYNNDIALLYVSPGITFGPNVQSVILPPQDNFIQDDSICTFFGWGSTFNEGPPTANLLKVDLPIVNQTRCINAYSGLYTINSNMICAGQINAGACTKDTGGPLELEGVLYGIQSFGNYCGSPNYPTVFTRVSKYVNWLLENMQ